MQKPSSYSTTVRMLRRSCQTLAVRVGSLSVVGVRVKAEKAAEIAHGGAATGGNVMVFRRVERRALTSRPNSQRDWSAFPQSALFLLICSVPEGALSVGNLLAFLDLSHVATPWPDTGFQCDCVGKRRRRQSKLCGTSLRRCSAIEYGGPTPL